MDLVEVHWTGHQADDSPGDLFAALEVCPVDYKAGAPKEGEEANELWDTDKMQLGLQALILRDNNYTCNEVSSITAPQSSASVLPSLPNWKTGFFKTSPDAKRVIAAPIPAPLVHSPKCVRCSLAPVCLPDETRMLAQTTMKVDVGVDGNTSEGPQPSGEAPRRLIAARDDTRPLYLNTRGIASAAKTKS